MAGILANSASKTHLAADTSADNVRTGYATGEQITLSVTPTGTNYEWGWSIPAGSSAARSALSSSTSASPKFTPDVAGIYTITCLVDGGSSGSYTLRIGVTAASVSQLVDALRHSPKEDSTIATPAVGLMQYFSDTFDQLAVKDALARVWPLLLGMQGANLTDADATLVIADGGRRVLPVSTLTAPHTGTLGTAGAVAGDVIEVVRLDTSIHSYTLVNGGAGAGTLTTMAGGSRLHFKATFDGTNWVRPERRPLS